MYMTSASATSLTQIRTITNTNLMRAFVVFFSLLLGYGSLNAQNLNLAWAKSMGGASTDEGVSIAVDASGNVYTTGYFNGTVDFDPNAGTFNLTSAGGVDIFVSKLDATGNLVWAKNMGGVSTEIGYSIAVDASGNVYTTGYFVGTADFNPNAGTFNLTSAGSQDIFVSKLDATVNLVWAKSMGGGANDDVGISIAVDASGNVYTTGFFNGTVDFDPNAGTFNLTSAGSQDIFVFKLDATGNLVWAKNMGGASNDIGQSIAVDASGNVYTTGYFAGTADFDPNAGTFNFTSAGGQDIFVSKLIPCAAIIISPATSLAVGTINTVYSQTLTQTGLTGTPVWSISAGSLPAGLTLASATGIISGTPIAGGSFSFTVQVSNGGCLQTKAYSIVVACTGIVISPATLTNGTVGGAYSQTLTQTGLIGTPAWSVSVGTLPSGLTLVGTTGVISGTPTTAGTTNFTISLTNGTGCTQTQVYSIVVACPTVTVTPTPTTQSYVVGTTISITLGATGVGGATYTYAVTSGALPAGVTLSAGVISGTPTTSLGSGTFTITATASIGGCTGTAVYNYSVVCPTLVFSVTSATGATVGTAYNLNAGVTGNTQSVVYSVSPTLPTGLSLNTATGIISGTPTASATSVSYTVTATQGTCFVTQGYAFAVVCPTIVFGITSATGATVGTPYSLNAGVTGNTQSVVYSVSPTLPTGLSINMATGIISGTPTTLTTSAIYTVTADQSGGVCIKTQTYTFGVTNCVAFALLPDKNFLPNGFVGVPYVGATISVAAPVAGVTYKYFKRNAINWQTGLILNENTGTITGTPSFSTSINVVIEAVNQTTGCGSILTSYTLVIFPDPTTAIDNSLANLVKVSPNPSSGDFNVDFGTINMAKSSVSVYDAQGKTVFTSENNSNLMTISLDKFANGIYLLEVKTLTGRITKKLAKQ